MISLSQFNWITNSISYPIVKVWENITLMSYISWSWHRHCGIRSRFNFIHCPSSHRFFQFWVSSSQTNIYPWLFCLWYLHLFFNNLISFKSNIIFQFFSHKLFLEKIIIFQCFIFCFIIIFLVIISSSSFSCCLIWILILNLSIFWRTILYGFDVEK